MTKKASSQWDVARFFTTLGYFGEVPFLGSFRWLQKWLGQYPTVAGKALSSMKKKAVAVGHYPKATFDSLQERVSPAVVLSAGQLVGDRTVDLASLCDAMTAVDTVAVWDCPDFSSLVSELSTCLGDDSEIVRQVVFDFTQADSDISAWGALDDVVMGGVSEGTFFLSDQGSSNADEQDSSSKSGAEQHNSKHRSAVFAGRVSTDNSGGFSSVRTRNFEPPFDVSGWTGLRLRVKGDGQRYKFIVRNSQAWDSPAYVYIFDTVADQWINVIVPFTDLVPTFRAKSVPSALPFDPSQTVSFQLMLSKFEYDGRLNPQFSAGPFRLAIAKIETYRARQGVPLVIVGSLDTAARDRQQSTLAESGLRYRFIEPQNQNLVDAIATALE